MLLKELMLLKAFCPFRNDPQKPRSAEGRIFNSPDSQENVSGNSGEVVWVL